MALPSKETLQLIQWLASRDASQLLVLAIARGVTPAHASSLTSLALKLEDDASVAAALRQLSRGALHALANLETATPGPGLDEVAALGLVDTRVTPPVALCAPHHFSVLHNVDLTATPAPQSSCSGLDPETLAKYGTVVAGILCELGDLVDALARHPQPATKTRSLSVMGVKALSEVLGDGYDIPALVDSAFIAGLLHSDGSKIFMSTAARAWREGSSEAQWLAVATPWWASVPSWLQRVVRAHPKSNWVTDLPALVASSYPLLDADEALAGATTQATFLGVLAGGCPTPWGASLWTDTDSLGLDDCLPDAVPGVYATEDFSLLAPGPLSLEHRLILDTVAHRELGGLIPRYRLTARSVLRALHNGVDPVTIVPMVTTVSQTPLPDGMVHLIEDTCRLAGDIELHRTRNGTTITVVRPILAAELLADPNLGPLSLRELDAHNLATKLPVERVQDILLASRYLALIAGDTETPLVAEVSGVAGTPVLDPLEAAVMALADTIHNAARHGVPPWLGSVLEVAIASKIALEIEVEMPGGDSVTLVMEPRSVGGGRLRGVELKNSMEKTIPISAIRQASPWTKSSD